MSDPSFWYGPWVTYCGIKGSFAFESLWVRHTSQCNTYFCISFVMPGQNMLSFVRSSVFVTPTCPGWTCFNISARSDLGMEIFWPLNIRPIHRDGSKILGLMAHTLTVFPANLELSFSAKFAFAYHDRLPVGQLRTFCRWQKVAAKRRVHVRPGQLNKMHTFPVKTNAIKSHSLEFLFHFCGSR